MLESNKISKPQTNSSPSLQEASESPISSDKTGKNSRCRFRQIPLNSKFSHINPLYPLFGDILLMPFKEGLSCDISFFNHFKSYRHIVVDTISNQKVVAIRPNPRTDLKLPSPNVILEQMSGSENPEMMEWAKITKVFYQKYDKVMKRQTRKKTKCDVRKKFYVKVTSKTEEKKKALFEKFPCIELRFRLRNHQSQLSEIIFDEKLIKELGYSIDSFVTTVLNEGIPQLMPYDSSIISEVKTLIGSYFQVEDTGLETEERDSTLMMKSGYVKNIKYQMHVLMNYETNTFGMDVILAVVSRDEPYLRDQEGLVGKINEEFVQEMAVRENEKEYFLSVFYNQLIEKRYTNLSKVCNIKEVSLEKASS